IRHHALPRLDLFRRVAQHLGRDIQPPNFSLRVPLLQNAPKPPLPTANIEDALAMEIPEETQQELNVINPRVDAGGKMFFVGGVPVERGADLLLHLAQLARCPSNLIGDRLAPTLAAVPACASPLDGRSALPPPPAPQHRRQFE